MSQKLPIWYPLDELNPFIECFEILTTHLGPLYVAFHQLTKRSEKKAFLDRPSVYY